MDEHPTDVVIQNVRPTDTPTLIGPNKKSRTFQKKQEKV